MNDVFLVLSAVLNPGILQGGGHLPPTIFFTPPDKLNVLTFNKMYLFIKCTILVTITAPNGVQ